MRWWIILGVVLAGCGAKKHPVKRLATELVARASAGELPRLDPAAPAWDEAGELAVPMQPQDLVEPKLMEPGVGELRVRALHDRDWVVFRIEWPDPSHDVVLGPGLFSDAVAVELPTEATGDVTDPAMGLRGRPVAISYWKAAWQETTDPVAALRPNMPPMYYPFQSAPAGQRAALEQQYAPARGAGNPSTLRAPGVAVQDLVAEGPGTITAAPAQRSVGRGAWQDGVWRVTLARPLGPPETSPFRPGRRTYVAFAVWDGAKGNAGAKKMRSVWVPLSLEDVP